MTEHYDSKEDDERPWDDPLVLRALYHEQELSQRDLADKFDCSRTAIRNAMDRHGVEPRDRIEGIRTALDSAPVPLRLSKGYEVCYVTLDYEVHKAGVHQLVAIANGADPGEIFTENNHVHHKNGIRWDNRPDNLEVLTASEHAKHHHGSGNSGTGGVA